MRATSLSGRRLQAVVVAALGALALLALGVPTAGAQAPYSARVIEHQITGPPDRQLNLVILGDGYTAGELDQFRRDVDRNLNVLWSVDPFKSYRNYINIYLLEIVSPESGVRCDPDGDPPNPNLVTALRLHFSDGCTNPLARGITYGPALQPGGGCPDVPGSPATGIGDPRCSGSQQRAKYMAAYLEPIGVSGSNVQTLALSNTFTYGGIGGTQATTSGGSPQGPLISMHELGHSLGTLADEYPYSARDVPGGPHGDFEPGSLNHSRLTHDEMVAGQLKWARWLCEESLSGGIITARDSTCGPPHESGATRSSNVWRPSEHSMMRWLGFYFDQVGRENMTWRITGRRTTNEMSLGHTPEGEVGPGDVLWVETGHP
ncbi:MAG: M64 family metallopeptidase, partial [Gaiellaceae bacterium]